MNFIAVSAFLVAFLHIATPAEMIEGGCNCAVFSVTAKEPLIEHALQYNVSCDDEGSEKCLQLCVALAQSAKERAPALICERLNRHVENLKVAVYTKACDAETWRFAGLESSDPICCHEGKDTTCDSQLPSASD